ncbi:MAG: hypothetical protein WBA93_08370 [Microcoleaceae cyanobacterium]
MKLRSQIFFCEVQRVIIAHQDKLARFGFDLLEWLCEQNNCELVILNNR